MASRKRKKKSRKAMANPWAVAALAALLIAAVFLAFHEWGSGPQPEKGAKVPPGIWRYGIDISHNNQGKIIWDSLYVMTDSRGRTVREDVKDYFTVRHEVGAKARLMSMYPTKAASTTRDQFRPAKAAATAASTAMHRNNILLIPSSLEALFPPPNFIENIGNSETSNRLRTTASTGRKTGPEHHPARKLSGAMWT